jgi:ABC-type nickel/cobalt efflux system permease component RcnA
MLTSCRQGYPAETNSSQEIKRQKCAASTHVHNWNRGGLSDYKKIERESTSVWHAHFYHDTSEKRKNQTASWLQKWLFVFKSGISNTKTAFRLQTFSCQFTKWRLALQSGISLFN